MRFFLSRLAFFSLFCGVWPVAVLAQITCDNGPGRICVEAVHSDEGVTFWAENRFPMLPVTLTLTFKLNNLNKPKGAGGPFVLRGATRTKLASFTAQRAGEWSYNYQFSWSYGDINARHDTSYRYRLPYRTGQAFELTQGCKGNFTHKGAQQHALDFSMPVGTPIHAARGGRVVAVEESSNKGGKAAAFKRHANFVIIEHSDGTLGQYFHLRKNGAKVRLGQTVRRGALLGYSGNTGQSTGPHLHFDVIKGAVGIESETLMIPLRAGSGVVRCPRLGARLVATQ